MENEYHTWRGICPSWTEDFKNLLSLHLINATVVRN